MADNFFGITDQGKMRDNNEDRFIAQTLPVRQTGTSHKRYVLACVIDGVGGYEGGEIASGLAHDSIINYLQKPFTEIIPALKNALAVANDKIYKRKQNEDAINEMACVLTLALADIQENKFYYAHVGDTRLYLLRDNSLVKVTKDHSFVGFLEDSGRLSEADAMNHPKRNEINKAIGFDEQQFLQPDYIETGESPFLPGDTLLLCSDGLSDLVDNKTMTSILLSNKTLKETGKALVKAANEAGGKDNITVVLVKNDKAQLTHEATKPIPIKKNEEPQPEEEPVIEKEEPVEEPPEKSVNEIPVVEKTERKKSQGILWFLIVILLAAVGWFVYKDYLKQPPKPKAVMPAPEKKISTDAQKFFDSINSKKEISLNKIFNAAQVVFTDSIVVDKDSLIIHGNNKSIIADSSFKNAAFIFSEHCKYIFIDSVTFENFNVGIVTKNTAVHLKNVRFNNCKVAVRHEILSNEKNISGKIDDSLVSLKKDSVKTKH
jgi:serine/threonine protein phosphatase PrpC